ncbi:MAG: cytochrome c3 family protein [Myxococcales bacterium]|nr:hypothetical protein [Myxococcota bacterium]MDW8283670.1 cytochrome c3 family protein [Myxococcales bacterium]
MHRVPAVRLWLALLGGAALLVQLPELRGQEPTAPSKPASETKPAEPAQDSQPGALPAAPPGPAAETSSAGEEVDKKPLAPSAARPRVNLSLPPGSIPPPPRPRLFGRAEPSPVIYPEQSIPLRFSHAQHLAQKIDCVFCHDQVEQSVSSRDNLLPKEETCETCHNIDHDDPFKKTKAAAAHCAACHPGFPTAPGPGVPAPGPALEALVKKVVLPAPNIKFNHQIHLRQRIACERCHGDLRKVELATRDHLPRMATCLGCHNDGLLSAAAAPEGGPKRRASPRCGTCHLLQQDGTIQVRYDSGLLIPSGNWKGDAHGIEFKREHRAVARSEPAYCASCHRQDWCQQCHNGIVKPMDFHGNDYVSRHQLDARRNEPNCAGCHRRQTFCIGCHERLGVVDVYTLPGNPPASAFFPAAPRRFHPDGWASPSPGPTHHAWEAQRNIRQCVSCHREDTCLQCHSALPGGRIPSMVGAGVNPHPNGWAGSSRCQALADRNPRMCLKCHQDGSPQLRCLEN